MTGFRLMYVGATISLGISALAKTTTYLLLRYFVDNFQKSQTNIDLPLIALGFIGLALCEGSFTFMSGRLAALTSEGTTRRLRNYLFDPIQNLSFTYHAKTETGNLVERATSNVYALRRFFSDQAIGIGRIFMLFTINFISLLNLNGTLALISIIVVPFVLTTSLFFYPAFPRPMKHTRSKPPGWLAPTSSSPLSPRVMTSRWVKAVTCSL